MALQWTPLRRRGGAVVRARQNIETLEHQTQANVLLAFKLSMVSGNGVNSVPRPNYRTYRKMADIGVQYESQDTQDFNVEPHPDLQPVINRTVAEINTSAEIAELDPPTVISHPTLHRPISIQSSTSSSSNGGSEEERERKLHTSSRCENVDIDAICVQQNTEEENPKSKEKKNLEKSEPDGFVIQEKEESNCGLDCLYFTMQCCECTIL